MPPRTLARLARLLRLARPQFLIAGVVLYVMGALWAVLRGAPLSLPRMLFGYLLLMPAHLSVSFSNDYFDVAVDRHGASTAFTGGSGILVAHPELRETARHIAIGLILTSMLLATIFVIRYAYPPWFLGYVLAGNLVGWFYSAPPLRFSYRRLGELSNAITAGFLIPGLGYLVARERPDAGALLLSVPLLLYGLAFIVAVEVPDMEADRLGSKPTLVARRGRGFGFSVIGGSLLAASASFVGLNWIYGQTAPLDFRVPGLISLLPSIAGLAGILSRPEERRPALRMVNAIVISVMIFFIAVDGYLAYRAMR